MVFIEIDIKHFSEQQIFVKFAWKFGAEQAHSVYHVKMLLQPAYFLTPAYVCNNHILRMLYLTPCYICSYINYHKLRSFLLWNLIGFFKQSLTWNQSFQNTLKEIRFWFWSFLYNYLMSAVVGNKFSAWAFFGPIPS